MRTLTVIAVMLVSGTAGAAIGVPVNSLDAWTALAFNRIPPNEVSADEHGLRVSVRGSASPLVYKLEKPARIVGFRVDATWAGSLNLGAGVVQGDEESDDFVLKFGIVESGDRRLNWLQRRIAADWIKQLFELAPRGSGVRRIHFLSTTQQADLVGTSRVHPLSDLLYETRILELREQGPFTLVYRFAEPVEALGLWLSVDGDDTGSDFDLQIDRITLYPD